MVAQHSQGSHICMHVINTVCCFCAVSHIMCMLGVSIVAHLCIEEESPQLVWHPNVEVQKDNTAKHSKNTYTDMKIHIYMTV